MWREEAVFGETSRASLIGGEKMLDTATATNHTDRPDAQLEQFLGTGAVIVESWRFILIPSSLVGLSPVVFFRPQPELYRSESVLRLSSDDIILLKSARVYGKEAGKAVASGMAGGRDEVVLDVKPSESEAIFNVNLTQRSPQDAPSVSEAIFNVNLT